MIYPWSLRGYILSGIWVSALTFGFIAGGSVEAAWQGRFVVFGRVSLPDGKPAVRVRVKIESLSGLKSETLSDDQGRYEFAGLGGGRYRVLAINPDEPEQYSEPAESDTTRAFANRVQIDVYLRLPLHSSKENRKPGTITVSQATQIIPKPARQVYEQGLKFQKENQNDKALASFNQSLELYPDYFQALTERGNLFMQQNKLVEALTDFNHALELNNQYSPALRGAGYCNLQQRKYEEAIGQLQKSLAHEPQIALTHMLIGYANLSLNRYDQAKLALQQALKIGADSVVRARVYLAEVLAHEQKYKEAADEIKTYLRLRPQAADAAKLKELEAGWRAQSKSEKN